jgi:hypothetical protein
MNPALLVCMLSLLAPTLAFAQQRDFDFRCLSKNS